MEVEAGSRDENKERKKYKPGDKVRISDKSRLLPSCYPWFRDRVSKLRGKIVTLEEDIGNGNWWIMEDRDYNSWHERWFEDIEPEKLKEAQTMKKYIVDLIIHCPTKELFFKVVQKLLDEGHKWGFNDEKEIYTQYWKGYWADCDYKEESCVALFTTDNRRMWYSHRSHFQEQYPSIPITPAEKFLGENTKTKENLKSETKDSTAQPDASRVKEKQGITTEEEARQIIFWYYDEFLGEETEEYPLLDIKKAVLRKKLLDEKELIVLLAPLEVLSSRKAAKNLGVFLYQMITEKSEYNDISFHLDGYPLIRNYNPGISNELAIIIERLANGKYRNIEELEKDIQRLRIEETENPTDDNPSNSEDAPLDSIPQYDYLGGYVYVPSDKNKQSSKSAPVPEWIVYQGVMVKNPDFVPPIKPLEPSNPFVPPESPIPDKIFDFALTKKPPKPYKLKKCPKSDIIK